MIVLGIGCDRNTPYATLAQAIDEALAQLHAGWQDVQAVASIDLKADEGAMQELQRVRGHRIHFYTAAQLAQVPVPNPSETVRKYTGTPSVSEAAALLVAGAVMQPGTEAGNPAPAPMTALRIEKHKLRGPDGRSATVSVAHTGDMNQP